jgi:hypothetical protein
MEQKEVGKQKQPLQKSDKAGQQKEREIDCPKLMWVPKKRILFSTSAILVRG